MGSGHGRHGSAILLVLALLGVIGASQAQAGPDLPPDPAISRAGSADWSVSLTARLDLASQQIEGVARITLWNPTPDALSEVRLFRYPDHYGVRPDLDDILWERVYPVGWTPASLTLGAVHAIDPDGARTPLDSVDAEGPTPVTTVTLVQPLAPGAPVTIEVPFVTSVPTKYGTFGVFRRVLTVSGGWHPLPVTLSPDGRWLPHAPPPLADWEIELDAPSDLGVVLGDLIVPPTGRGTEARGGGDGWTLGATERRTEPDAFVPNARSGRVIHGAIQRLGPRTIARYATAGRRWVGLTARRAFHQRNVPLGDGTSLTFVGRPLSRPQVRWLRQAVLAAREAMDEAGLRRSGEGVLVIEAPLRRKLIELGDGVLYVSDRFLEADRIFWRYHDLHLARAVMALDLEPVVVAREEPELAELVLDGASWALVGDYLETRWKNHVSLRGLLARFSFFPQVETLLETPAFPFADQIFDNPWIVDPLQADIRRFNRPLRSGRTLFLRLGDRVGESTLRQAILRYLAQREPLATPGADLFTVLRDHSGLDARPLANAWLGEVPRVDFEVADVARDRTAEGFHRTTVTVRRRALEGDAPDEAVEIRLKPAGPGRKGHVWLRWEGREEAATWDVITRRRMGVVEVDPRGRLLEMDEHGLSLKQDNRRPQQLRVSGFGYAGLSLTGQGFEAYGLLNVRPRHNARHQLNIRAFTNEQSLAGGGLTYAHYFGPPRWGLSLRHRVVFTADVVWLNQRFRATEAPLLAELSAGYIYESRSNSFMPSRGRRLALTVTFGKDFTLQDDSARSLAGSGFLGLDAQGIQLIRLHAFHVLALRGKAGFVVGNVQHSRFTVGGNGDLRGIPEAHLLSPGRVSGAVEWRHFFFKDADIPNVAHRVRALQGAFFVEGAFAAKSLSIAPTTEELHISVGYGFRWFVDWLGVLPGTWGMDFAWSPGAPPGLLPIGRPGEWPSVPFQVYFAGTQSF